MPDVFMNGPAGRLEGRLNPAPRPEAPTVLILHPHPEYGGSMTNKVVFTLERVFRRRDFTTLRINFRGVGRSDGQFDRGHGEREDAAAALSWLAAQQPHASARWVAGYSFGAWIGLKLTHTCPGLDRLVVVAPPITLLDFAFLQPGPWPVPGLVVQGDKDTLVPEARLADFIIRAEHSVTYRVVSGADHFFEQHMTELEHHINAYIGN